MVRVRLKHIQVRTSSSILYLLPYTIPSVTNGKHMTLITLQPGNMKLRLSRAGYLCKFCWVVNSPGSRRKNIQQDCQSNPQQCGVKNRAAALIKARHSLAIIPSGTKICQLAWLLLACIWGLKTLHGHTRTRDCIRANQRGRRDMT